MRRRKRNTEFTRFAGIMKYFVNMSEGRFHVKGSNDGNTTERVLASKESHFTPNTCFFDYVDNLPDGTYYVSVD